MTNNYTKNVSITSVSVYGRIVWASSSNYALICEIPYWLYSQGYRCNSITYDVAYAGNATVSVSTTSNLISVKGIHIIAENKDRIVACTLYLTK